MISKKLKKMMDEQIQFEYFSRNIYFGMESYLRELNYDGFAEWMHVQADEEMIHTRYFMEYIVKCGEKFEMLPIEGTTNDYESLLDVFETGLEHEREVTKRIYALYDQAVKDKDYLAQKFLNWYVDEQAEEEENFSTWIARLKRATDEASKIYLDDEAGTRVLTQPANPPVTLK